MQEMAQSLQSAQQSLANAGQQQAQNGQNEASESEMGKEFGQQGQSGQSGQKSGAQSQGSGSKSQSGQSGQQTSQSKGSGGGLGNPGQGAGGHVGPQQPLPGTKKDQLVAGQPDWRKKTMQRTYKGTSDPTQDRAAYYAVAAESKKTAEAALNREDIPAATKKTVESYFKSIQPQ